MDITENPEINQDQLQTAVGRAWLERPGLDGDQAHLFHQPADASPAARLVASRQLDGDPPRAMYLLVHRGDDTWYVGQAEELLRFGEDQFVVWERPMPREYQRRKDIDPDKWILPCALEQYDYYEAIDASASKMILGFQKAYEVTGKELYLAKTRALANAMTVAQVPDGPNGGLYLTVWEKPALEQKAVVREKPFELYWINCAAHDIRAMLSLQHE